jgi:hypothetical protein
VFDEEFAAAARFTEPSAGERAGRPGWLALRRADRGSRLSSWPPHTRRLAILSLTLVLLAAVVAGAGWSLLWELRHAPRRPAGQPGTAAATPLADPFAGSPAERYQAGPAGIVPPVPQAVGRYSRAEVTAAYATARHLLIAAHLDRSALLGRAPDAFARLLTATQRRYLLRHLGAGGSQNSRTWITSFAPGSVEFPTGVIKVHGTMSAVSATASGGSPVLRVRADYLYVYAVQPPGRAAGRMRVVVRSVDRVDFARWESPHGALQPWWNPLGSVIAGSCDFRGGFIHPGFMALTARKHQPAGRPVDPYARSFSPSSVRHCQPATGT